MQLFYRCVGRTLAGALLVLASAGLVRAGEISNSEQSDRDYQKARKAFLEIYELSSSETFDRTDYSDIYAVHSKDGGTQLFTHDMKWAENNGRLGWSLVDSKADVPAEELRKLYRRTAKEIPLDVAIKVNRGSQKFAFVVLSAVDCPACIKMEKSLSKIKGISYYVMPTSLTPENKRFAVNVWCAKSPAAAWGELMTARKSEQVSDCGYPERRIGDFTSLYGGSVPRLVFPDGDVLVGWSDEWIEGIRENLRQNIFFGN